MKTWRSITFGRALVFVAVVGLLLFAASGTFAAGVGAVSVTQTFHNVTLDLSRC